MINTKDKLIELFKEIKYTPFPEIKPYVGLADQFSEYALEMICNELVARGVTFNQTKEETEKDFAEKLIHKITNTPTKFGSSYHMYREGISFRQKEIVEMIKEEIDGRAATTRSYNPGDAIWVIERENGEPISVFCAQFLAKSKGCVIATAWVEDLDTGKTLDIDKTIQDHIAETSFLGEVGVMFYPEEDYFATKEEAEDALRKENVEND